MKILHTDIYKFSIPMVPFTIATGTMHYAQNILIRIHTDAGYYGVGECSAFPMIVGETQATCYEMAKDFAAVWKGREALAIEERMQELHAFTAFNATIKSAFDMALYDLSAREAGLPLYQFLGGSASHASTGDLVASSPQTTAHASPGNSPQRPSPRGPERQIETDLTIGIDTPEKMAQRAVQFKADGVRMIKIKLGKNALEDVERVRRIRNAVGTEIILRIDANQGWDYDGALYALQQMGPFNVQFCEQPMRHWHDDRLPELRRKSPIRIMADESVFDHHDARKLIAAGACDFVNIKMAKSGGILEAIKINALCSENKIPCMMGGMLESRVALTAFAHFALASDNIIFYDMDTCLLGHTADPVTGGVTYRGYFLEIPDRPGLGADVDEVFLAGCEQVRV